MVRAVLSLSMKKESITVNRRQKFSKWNGISHLILERSLRQPPSAVKVMAIDVWRQNG
jgi:hypothetical protein